MFNAKVVSSFLYSKIFKESFKLSLKNYCTISGRPRGIYRQFKVSRILVKDLGGQGLLFGLQKAS
jgi:small subunit ribosomal protein S14